MNISFQNLLHQTRENIRELLGAMPVEELMDNQQIIQNADAIEKYYQQKLEDNKSKSSSLAKHINKDLLLG